MSRTRLISTEHWLTLLRPVTVPVTISARNAKLDQTKLTPRSNIDVTNFVLDNTQQGHNNTMEEPKGVSLTLHDRENVHAAC